MKYITLIIGLLVVGCCGKQEQTDTDESTPTTNTNEVDGTTEKPVKELTLEEKQQKALRDSVLGEYELAYKGQKAWKGNTSRQVFLENGLSEWYLNGKKREELKWSIVDKEIHEKGGDGLISVYRINPDKSITQIATVDRDGERTGYQKEWQGTFKKIK